MFKKEEIKELLKKANLKKFSAYKTKFYCFQEDDFKKFIWSLYDD